MSERKRKIKKAPIIIISVVLLLIISSITFILLGKSNIKIEITKGIAKEINYKDENFEYPKVECRFFGNNISKDNLKLEQDINLEKLGEQTIKYKCSKWFFETEKEIQVKVVDIVPPELKLNGDIELSLYVGDKYEEKGATASDNVDGDLTASISVEPQVDTSKEGTVDLTYSVTDSSGNTTTAKRSIKVNKKPEPAKTSSGGSSSLGCGEAGVIYLTFDDGPSTSYTAHILDVLKKYNVKATFFVTGRESDALIKREFDEGHAVAVHTWTHDYGIIYKSSEAFWSDMQKVQDRIKRVTGEETNLFRFPGGSSNTVSRKYKSGIMTELAKEMGNKGYAYFDWNISSGDAGGTTDPNVEYKNVVNSLSKKRGNVVLMHDIKKHTSESIERMVKYGLDNGYTFKVLTPDVVCHQRINN